MCCLLTGPRVRVSCGAIYCRLQQLTSRRPLCHTSRANTVWWFCGRFYVGSEVSSQTNPWLHHSRALARCYHGNNNNNNNHAVAMHPLSPNNHCLIWQLSQLSQCCQARRRICRSAAYSVRRTGAVSEDKQTKWQPTEQLSIFQRFKRMYKEYWYVLLPVHLATSSVWFGVFYYASKSGVDVAGVLQWMGVGETIVDKLRHSSAGHVAVAYALYKLATPARYTVTLGGTTYAIKLLSARGYIKPVPSRAEMRQIYHERRGELMEKVDELRQRRRKWRENFQERRKKLFYRRK